LDKFLFRWARGKGREPDLQDHEEQKALTEEPTVFPKKKKKQQVTINQMFWREKCSK
jgi:hypothetical protein